MCVGGGGYDFQEIRSRCTTARGSMKFKNWGSCTLQSIRLIYCKYTIGRGLGWDWGGGSSHYWRNKIVNRSHCYQENAIFIIKYTLISVEFFSHFTTAQRKQGD